MDWVQEHFKEILIGAGALFAAYWAYQHLGGLLRGRPKNKFYCRHCNWEGTVGKRNRRCGRCGSRDLGPVTH